ncbi:MAG: TldD/PmbA family protein [Myxococcota bacterium]
MSQLQDAARAALEAALNAGADAADTVVVLSDSLETRVRGEEVDFVKQARERTLGIRALVRGEGGMRSAITSTSDLGDEAVAKMAKEAALLAQATAVDPAAGLPEGGFADANTLPDLGLVDPADRGVTADARIADAQRAETAARSADARITNSEGSQASSDFNEIVYANSEGFLGSYESAYHGLFAEPLAQDDAGMQRDYWMTVGRRLADLDAPESVGREAADRALRRLGARPVPTCEAPVIFDPRTAASLWGQLAGLVSGYAVYRGTTFLAEKLGEQIGFEGLDLVDDGLRPGGLGSRPFDGEGLPARRTPILESGRLSSWLLDSYSARKLGLASTGNATRSAGSAPGVGAANLGLEPGNASLEDLIADTPRGLLVTELIGMGFNPVNGDYSRGAAGMWIENGKLTHPVEEITIAGNFGDMLRDIDAIGSDLLWLSRIGSPSVRVARMTIAGDS